MLLRLIAGLAMAGPGIFGALPAHAQSLPADAFQIYDPADAGSIQPGPFSLFEVPVDEIQPGQLNVGFSEVARKIYGWDTLNPSQLQATLLTDIEPVVIGPGGILVLENGHHTFTSLEDSAFGAADPDVFVNVIANFSNMSTAQFWATMQADDLLLPLNDGVPEVVSSTGAPISTTLQGLTNDPYRGLEESILKNKSSKLFKTTSNITGQVGASIPGLDKLTGDFSDFLWADSYRNANGGLGLPYLSPGDVALATQWNLNPNSTTTLPNIGQVTVAQLPGFILEQDITIASTISNATLSTGTLAGNGTFTGITAFNLGTPGNPILVGTPPSGFIMQLGFDAGKSVTLSGDNTYTGGTTIIAGDLIIASDASLGAAAPASYTINPNSILASVEAANGIIFNSEDEGMGTLTIGTTPGNGTATFTTDRPIAVDGETATIDLNGYRVTLNGQIVSLGTNGDGLGNESGISALTINDTSANANGELILPANANNSGFYGNWIVTAGTLNVSSDASLGNTTGPSYEIGQIELNGGTLQAGASFSSVRSLFLDSGSTYDTNGHTTSWGGTLTDVQRTLTIENSNSSGTGAVGSVTFGSLAAGATAIIALDAGAGTTGGDGTTVTFANGITRNGDTSGLGPADATVFIDPASGSDLGTSGANGVEMFSSGASTTMPNNGIAPAWIITDSGGSASSNPYNFVTYSSTNGYQVATYTDTGSGSTGGISTATDTSVVAQTGNATLGADAQAYALKVENGDTIMATGFTLTLGDGTDPAGLILEGSASIAGGTLAFGASEAVIDVKSTNTISATITGTGGLTLAGSGTLVLSGASSTLSGPIAIDSGTLQLNTANYFPTSGGGTTIWLSDVKSKPSAADLAVDASNVISALDSDGSNSTVDIATGVILTIGDSNNLNSTLSSTIAGTGTGSLVKAGTGLLDISGSGGVSFGSGGTVTVEAGALRIGNGLFSTSATTPITVDAGAELQYSGNSGSQFNDPIQGNGVFHLVGGVVQLTSTSNTYAGGTVLEAGTTLDVTTANLPTNAVISNAGGILLFDQDTVGIFTGVMSDGRQAGGPGDPNDISCTLVSCSTATLSGTLIKDDSTTGSGGNVTIANAQAYTGMTYVEAGTLTLGAVNTIATSEGVVLGRIGGAVCNPSPCSGATAILALGADNTIAGLADDTANTTEVELNGHTLTLAPLAGLSWSYGGSIVDNGASGNLVQNGPGTSVLTGTSTYTGTTTVDAGVLEVNGEIADSSGVAVNSGGTLAGDGKVDPPTVTIYSGGTFAPGLSGSPGTSMTIDGNLAFQPGAMYLVQLGASGSTYANVTGTAALAGDVFADFVNGTNPQKQYTILQSAGLNGTTFAGLGTDLPNFDLNLSYTSDDVLLNLTAALGVGAGLNANAQNIATALNTYFNDGGTLPDAIASLYGLRGSALENALSQLSGEEATGAQQSGFKMGNRFLSLLLDPFADGRNSGFGAGSGASAEAGETGATALAYAADAQASLPTQVAQAYGLALKEPPPAVYMPRWNVWGAGFGGTDNTSGDATLGSHGTSAATGGFAVGADDYVAPDTMLGFSLAGGGTGWSTSSGLGSGQSQVFQAGLYGVHEFGPAYVAGAFQFGNYWVTTNRTITIADGGTLQSEFSAQGYGGRIEGGYRVPLELVTFTPYGAVQPQAFLTPGYSEYAITGSSAYALSYDAQTGTEVRGELGSWVNKTVQLPDGTTMNLFGRAAYAHDWQTNADLSANFLSLPAASFVVNGAQPPENLALITAGTEWRLSANWSLTAKFEGEFGAGYGSYAGTGRVTYTW